MAKTFVSTILDMIIKKEKEYGNLSAGTKDTIVADVLNMNTEYKKEHIEDIVNVLCRTREDLGKSRESSSYTHHFQNPLYIPAFRSTPLSPPQQ